MPAGRPAAFDCKEDMQKAIDDYFNNPPIKPFVTKEGQTIELPFLSITGLCLALGFESRQSFYDYEEKPEFTYTIKKARMLIENEYEFQLQKGNTTGAIFALKNFGWKDKSEVANNITVNPLSEVIKEISGKTLGPKSSD